jgi:hypothetical protein
LSGACSQCSGGTTKRIKKDAVVNAPAMIGDDRKERSKAGFRRDERPLFQSDEQSNDGGGAGNN